MLTVGLIAITVVTALVSIAKATPFPWSIGWWIAAGVATAAALFYIWYNTANKINDYTALNDSDGWVTAGWALSSLMTAGIGAAWFFLSGPKLGNKILDKFDKLLSKLTGSGVDPVTPPPAE